MITIVTIAAMLLSFESLRKIGTGLLAIPVLAGSSSYALAESLGWKEGLYRNLDHERNAHDDSAFQRSRTAHLRGARHRRTRSGKWKRQRQWRRKRHGYRQLWRTRPE